MNVKFRRALCLAFVVITIFHKSEGSLIDAWPIVSQAKSLFQLVSGDADGARKTQENFSRTNPGAAVVRSLVEVAGGHHEAARKTVGQFGDNAYSVVKSVPVVGHGIGVGHYIAGERKQGDQIMRDATRPVAVVGGAVVGGVVGGPAGGAAGAVAGGAAYDGIVTGIDSAPHGKYRPNGLVSYGTNVVKGESSPGETFDTGVGLGLDAIGGYYTGPKISNGKSSGGVKPSGGTRPSSGTKSSSGARPSGSSQSSQRFGTDNPNRLPSIVDDINALTDHFSDLRITENVKPGRQTVRKSKNLITNEGLRKIQDWENSYINTAGPRSVHQVTNLVDMYNCAYCTLGGLKRITVDRIIDLVDRMDIDGAHMQVNIQEIGTIFQRAGYERVSIRPFQQVGNPDFYTPVRQHPIGSMLQNTLEIGQTVEYGLGYAHSRGGHVVVLKAWKNLENGIESRIIDFQKAKNQPGRFIRDQIPSGETFLIHLGDDGVAGGSVNSVPYTRGSRFGSVSQNIPAGTFRNNNGWITLTTTSGRSSISNQSPTVGTEATTLRKESIQNGGWIGMSVGNTVGQNHCGKEAQRCRFEKDCCSGHLCYDNERYPKAWTCFAYTSIEGYGKSGLKLTCGSQGQRCRSNRDCCSNICFDSDVFQKPWSCHG